jgi:hypothetical protein
MSAGLGKGGEAIVPAATKPPIFGCHEFLYGPFAEFTTLCALCDGDLAWCLFFEVID